MFALTHLTAFMQVYDQCARVAQLVLKENGLAERVKVPLSEASSEKAKKQFVNICYLKTCKVDHLKSISTHDGLAMASLMLRSGRW